MSDFSLGPLTVMLFIFIVRAVIAFGKRQGTPELEQPPKTAEAPRPIPIEELTEELSKFQSRLVRLEPEPGRPFVIYSIQARGRFPITESTQVVLAASVFDVLDHKAGEDPVLEPVFSWIGRFREQGAGWYHDENDLGVVLPGYGFRQWCPVLQVIPASLVPPEDGLREFRLLLVAFGADRAPVFDRGFVEGDVLAAHAHDFTWEFIGTSYRDHDEQAVSGEEAMIHLALAVAVAVAGPGTVLEDARRRIVADWIEARVDLPAADARIDRKHRLEATLEKATANAHAGKSDLPRQIRRVKANPLPTARLEAIELCLAVATAQGVRAEDLATLQQVAEALQIEPARYRELIDKRLPGLSADLRNEGDLHALLGIDPAWDTQRTREHLMRLYDQWNSRAESLPDPARRVEAERMLELIAQAREQLVGAS